MNKLCIVVYGAEDKSFVREFSSVRVISVKSETPGFFSKRKIRKFTEGFICIDRLGFVAGSVKPSEKGLFRRDIARVIKQYCCTFGIDCDKSEIAVYGFLEQRVIRELSEIFSMVWLFGCPSGDCPNAYSVKTIQTVITPVSVYADESFSVPVSGTVFNLTDIKIPSVSNIEVFSDGLQILDSLHRNEVVRLADASYEIISFIK